MNSLVIVFLLDYFGNGVTNPNTVKVIKIGIRIVGSHILKKSHIGVGLQTSIGSVVTLKGTPWFLSQEHSITLTNHTQMGNQFNKSIG
jgi:hypothetical protein